MHRVLYYSLHHTDAKDMAVWLVCSTNKREEGAGEGEVEGKDTNTKVANQVLMRSALGS